MPINDVLWIFALESEETKCGFEFLQLQHAPGPGHHYVQSLSGSSLVSVIHCRRDFTSCCCTNGDVAGAGSHIESEASGEGRSDSQLQAHGLQ